jgi:hypothetical protein
METKTLTAKQLYMRDYNQRPLVEAKKKLRNKKLQDCECGGYFTFIHKKQHIEGVIHQNFLKTGVKFIKKESEMNKQFFDSKLQSLYDKLLLEKNIAPTINEMATELLKN